MSVYRAFLYLLGVALLALNTSMACTCLKWGMLSSVYFFGIGSLAGLALMFIARF